MAKTSVRSVSDVARAINRGLSVRSDWTVYAWDHANMDAFVARLVRKKCPERQRSTVIIHAPDCFTDCVDWEWLTIEMEMLARASNSRTREYLCDGGYCVLRICEDEETTRSPLSQQERSEKIERALKSAGITLDTVTPATLSKALGVSPPAWNIDGHRDAAKRLEERLRHNPVVYHPCVLGHADLGYASEFVQLRIHSFPQAMRWIATLCAIPGLAAKSAVAKVPEIEKFELVHCQNDEDGGW